MKVISAKVRKNQLLFSLLLIGLIHSVILSRVYWNNSVPVGWDTPAYIHMTKLILRDGVFRLVQESYYSHFYTIFSSFIVALGFFNPFSLEIVLPIVLSVVSVMLAGFAMWKWFRDKNLALFAAFFASGWYILFALTASIHRNLMAFVFLLMMLAYLPTYFERRRFSLTALLWLLGILMVLTHWETYVVSVGLLVAYAFALKIISKKTRTSNLLMGLLLYIIPLVVGVVALSPVLPSFLAHYIANWVTVRSNVPFLELLLYLGGQLLPLVVLGFASSIKKLRNLDALTPPLALLVSWALIDLATASVVPFLEIPLPQWRILVYFPIPFLAALGFDFALKYLRRRKDIGVRLGRHQPILMVLVLAIIIINSWVATLYADAWMRSYINEKTYKDLRWVERNYTFNQKPIVVFYFKAGEYTDGTLALYRNWINATIGEHYAYYGKLQYLLAGYAMPFHDQEYNRVSIKTWNELKPINPSISAHPMLIIEGDFYPGPSAYEKSLLYEIAPSLFLLNSSFLSIPDFYNVHLVAFRDSYSSSNNWYSTEKNWAIENRVVEHFENSTKEEFNMTFSLPIYRAGNYTINIQMFDYATTSAPVEIALDNATLYTASFNGTMRPKTFKFGTLFLQPKLYFLTLRINDPYKTHQISLDYVESLLED